jgi:cell division protein FtsZ
LSGGDLLHGGRGGEAGRGDRDHHQLREPREERAVDQPADPVPALNNVFIPPAPASRVTAARRAIEPMAGSVPNAAARAGDAAGGGAFNRVSTLFARVTGSGRGRGGRGEGAGEGSERSAGEAKGGPRLGGVSPDDRLPSTRPEDDLLDIPAFLRRQAN